MAVFTPLAPTQLEEAANFFNLGPLLKAEGIATGTDNTIYRLETTKGTFALTLFEGRTPEADLPWYMGLSQTLHEGGIPCPRALAGAQGAFLFYPLAHKPCMVAPWLMGACTEHPTPEQFTQAGQMLARIHLAGQRVPPYPNRCGKPFINDIASRVQNLKPQGPYQAMTAALCHELAALQGAPALLSTLPQGAGHFDYFMDNVLWQAEHLTGVLDFNFAGTDALAYDLAIALSEWGFTKDKHNPAGAKAFLAGYQQARPLSEAELAALPTLLRLACCRFLATRLLAALQPTQTVGTAKDPAVYASRLHTCQTLKTWTDFSL